MQETEPTTRLPQDDLTQILNKHRQHGASLTLIIPVVLQGELMFAVACVWPGAFDPPNHHPNPDSPPR